MKYLLSIKTVVPRKGAKVWYDDQRAAHDQIYQGHETIEHSFSRVELFSYIDVRHRTR